MIVGMGATLVLAVGISGIEEVALVSMLFASTIILTVVDGVQVQVKGDMSDV